MTPPRHPPMSQLLPRFLPLLALLLAPLLAAQDAIPPTPSPAFPSPQQWARGHKARGAGQPLPPGEEILRTETFFVHQEAQEKWTWGPRGSYKATLPIHRYFGSREQIQAMVGAGLMPAKATLVIPADDCDSNGWGGSTETIPEIDQVYLNGHYVGTLKGENEELALNLLEVPLEWIHFPAAPGETADNHLEILVDTGNDTSIWVLGQLWQALVIPAPSPILLVHGWTDIQDMLSSFQEQLSHTLGVPSFLAFLPAFASPELNGLFLQDTLSRLTRRWGVEKFHVVGHSKGGLDLRVLIDAAGENSPLVRSAFQISTPNLGSRVADVISYPSGLLERGFSQAAAQVADARRSSPGFRSLRTEDCRLFNQRFHSPNVPLHTVMGMVETENLPMTYRSLVWLSDLPLPNDGIVTVASAHALNTQFPESPLDSQDTSLYDHSSIVRAGAPAPLQLLHRILQQEMAEQGLNPPPAPQKTRSSALAPPQAPAPEGVATDSGEAGEPSSPGRASWTFLLKGGTSVQRRLSLASGEFTLMLISALEGTQAQILLPGESLPHPLECLPADETPFFQGSPLLGTFRAETPGEALLAILAPQEAPERLVTLLFRGNQAGPPRLPGLQLASLSTDQPPPGEILLEARLTGLGEEEAPPGELEWSAFSLEAPETPLPREWLAQTGRHEEGEGEEKTHLFSARFSPGRPGTWRICASVPGTGGVSPWELPTGSLQVQTYGGKALLSSPLEESVEDSPEGRKRLVFQAEAVVGCAGRHALTAVLATPDGTELLTRGFQWDAQPDTPQTCRLVFEEEALPQMPEDTPLLLKELRLFWKGTPDAPSPPVPLLLLHPNQPVDDTCRTLFSTLSRGASLSGEGTERLLQPGALQGAQLELTLAILLQATPPDAPLPAITLPLFTASGQCLAQATTFPRQREDGSWEAVALFPRGALLHAQEDGPYTVRKGYLSRVNDQGETEYAPLQGEYQTKPYSRFLFHDAWLREMATPGQDRLALTPLPLPEEETGGSTPGPALRLQFAQGETETPPSPGDEFLLFYPLQDSAPPFARPAKPYAQDGLFGSALDLTEDVRALLPALGNGNALLEEGESLDLAIPLQRELTEEERNSLALLILSRESPAPIRKAQAVLHIMDKNQDLSIDPEEAEYGRRLWKAGCLSPEILLNGLYLNGHPYQYDYARGKHLRRE